jgi:hypothetical protein
MTATSLLAIQLRTLFVLTGTGRIERENDPDRSPGPRLWLAAAIPRTVLQHRCEQHVIAAGRRPAGPSFSGRQFAAWGLGKKRGEEMSVNGSHERASRTRGAQGADGGNKPGRDAE